jgi:NAD(P)H-hydrate epimerase
MPVPVLTTEEMREWERATWATGQTEAKVIARVGEILAEKILSLTGRGEKILILAGKGHNGDDARAAQKHLEGREKILLNVTDPKKALEEWPALPAAHLIVDGLFGIGLNRALDADWKRFIERINRSNIPVLAVDVPSGLNAATGLPEGVAVRAEITLTLGAPKSGLILLEAAPFVGRLEVASEIGLIDQPFSAHERQWILARDFEQFPPHRKATGHKGDFGHVAIVAGSVGYHGAGVLAARGALRARPGLVTLFAQQNIYAPVAAQLQAAMVHPWRAGKKLPDSTTAILFGPGLAADDLSPDFKSEMVHLWEELPCPVVVDASGLSWLPKRKKKHSSLRVITPHPGEAARMLGTATEKIQSDRTAAVRELSRRFGDCHVVLKGHQTLIGASKGPIMINGSGNPGLAQGGSGDVLAGYLGGLLAQPILQKDPAKTISYAIWQHGAAADSLQGQFKNWTIAELVGRLGAV